MSAYDQSGHSGNNPATITIVLFAVLARREIAVVARLRSELRWVVLPICADVAVSLDHRVPELVLVVVEHLLLLDLLDIDVLDRAFGWVIESDRTAGRVGFGDVLCSCVLGRGCVSV